MDERAKDFLDIATNRPGSTTRGRNKHSGVERLFRNWFQSGSKIRAKNVYAVGGTILIPVDAAFVTRKIEKEREGRGEKEEISATLKGIDQYKLISV